MRIIKDIKITTKILSIIIAMLIFMTTIGVLGIINMKKLDSDALNMYNNNYISTVYLSALKENLLQVQIVSLNSLRQENKNNIPLYIKNIDNLTKINDETITKYEKTISSDIEQSQYQVFKQKLLDYRNDRENFLIQIEKNDYTNAEISYSKLSNLDKELDKLIGINIKQADDNNKANEKFYKTSITIMIIIILISLISSLFVGLKLTNMIKTRLKKLQDIVNRMGEGDFSFQSDIAINDEIGAVTKTINESIKNIASLIKSIIEMSESLSSNSEELSATTEEVSSKMEIIADNSKQIGEGTISLANSIQEISTSENEIVNIADKLNKETENTVEYVKEIQTRAENIKEKGIISSKNSEEIYKQKEEDISSAIKDAEVVNEITKIVEIINDIAGQTHLLSLNASIESAKAGEFGKGFNVISEEIRKLADQSKYNVQAIQELISKVNKAFNHLSSSSKDILEYINNTVKPDYEFLIDTATKYNQDANFVQELSQNIKESTKVISDELKGSSATFQSIGAISEETSASTEEIVNSIKENALAIEDIAKCTMSQSEMAQGLNRIIEKFKI